MQQPTVVNFGGITNAKFTIKPITLLIGPQASGKSLIAKVLYYFRSLFKNIFECAVDGTHKATMLKHQKSLFKQYFPPDTWTEGSFKLVYVVKEVSITVSGSQKKGKEKVEIGYSAQIDKLFTDTKRIYKKRLQKFEELRKNEKEDLEIGISDSVEYRSYRLVFTVRSIFTKSLNQLAGKTMRPFSQYFVPAGRNFYSNIKESIFSMLKENQIIDPFFIEFGSFYSLLRENYERRGGRRVGKKRVNTSIIDNKINDIMGGSYQRLEDDDFIYHKDKRKVRVLNASSGQQETLPLLLMLKEFMMSRPVQGHIIYIEEPEAHLFNCPT